MEKNQKISNLSIFLLNLRFQSKVLFSLQEVQKVTFCILYRKNNDIIFNLIGLIVILIIVKIYFQIRDQRNAVFEVWIPVVKK
ncbi:MAG: hypothetical protein J6K22_09045 [Spirochaetaceae bacterium]|nr:hypothetical protein [Spirochaetaceae bacterium]